MGAVIAAALGRFLLATLTTAAAGLVSPAPATVQPPNIRAINAAVTISPPKDGFAGTARIRVKFCAEIGPRALIRIHETRKIGASIKASRKSVARLGAGVDRIQPYRCARRTVRWRVPSRLLVGGGTYSVNVRVRDGRGRLSQPLGFSLRR
ncbi:MAG: hypothetical protein ACRDNY_04850 [Gaiellaceae bacterium]